LKSDIKKEQDDIGMLRADWAHLIRPERIQALSDSLTDLQPLTLNQIVKAEQLPDKAPRVDSIGRKLEDLGLGAPTNTPRDGAGASGATPSSSTRTKR
jgi:hypothetical protein